MQSKWQQFKDLKVSIWGLIKIAAGALIVFLAIVGVWAILHGWFGLG